MNPSSEKSWKKEIHRDCLHHMRGAAIVRLFLDLTALIAPSITAWMIGDMTDSLLLFDVQEISLRFPLFIAALMINVLGVPLLQLFENLLLTANGFSYSRYLVGKYLCLPLSQTQKYDPSTVVTRCEVDVTNFYFHQIYRCTRPVILCLYFLLLGITIHQNQYPIGMIFLLCFAILPVIQANHTGTKAAQLTAERAQYREERRALEHMLFSNRDFLREYNLIPFTLEKADSLFHQYMDKSGHKSASLDAANDIVSFLSKYGVQAAVMIVGSIFIAFGKSTVGAMLTCILILPSVTKACTFAAQWILAIRAEPEDQKRMEFFYGEQESNVNESLPAIENLQICNVTFSYPGKTEPTLKNFSYDIPASGCVWLRGCNGSGKSTLLNLLCGQYAPSSGQICYNGQPLSVSMLRAVTAYQEQDGAIFSATIDENLFAPSTTTEKKENLMKSLGLQKPLDFTVTHQGTNLSPGERKKILLARALLKDAPFLVLDEPENHLDPAARIFIKQLLRQRKEKIILVSHQKPSFGSDDPLITVTINL